MNASISSLSMTRGARTDVPATESAIRETGDVLTQSSTHYETGGFQHLWHPYRGDKFRIQGFLERVHERKAHLDHPWDPSSAIQQQPSPLV